MGSQKPVVVYAASGYTGRLACEWLARLKVPFVAAGRNQARLEEVAQQMRGLGADCEARAAEHTPRGLRELFRGAKVVVNISGPFSLLGHAVVDAALVEGCHYLDSTGEQDFMLDVRGEYGAAFESARLVLSPSCAYLWGIGAVAAEMCLETPGVDDLEVVYAPPSLQTIASLQSMMRTARRPGFAIIDGEMRLLPPSEVRQVLLPDGTRRPAIRAGAGEATFFEGDGRTRRCETFFANETLGRVAPIFKLWNGLTTVVSGETLDRWSDDFIARLKKNPPPEDPETQRYVVVARGKGPKATMRAVLRGTSPYAVTGFLCAMAAKQLLAGKALRHGYASIAQALGARNVLDRLAEIGTTGTVEADRAVDPAPRSRWARATAQA
jgi:Family of unknown function (DUF5938)/Saccharopine dehydrogenase NADP binding domain